ncbi:hypothetical protein D9M72_483310 [compost metagenome]
MPLAVRSLPCCVSWLTLTASVALVPVATFTILVLATSMPPVVTLGPPVMVRPLLLIVVLPVVTEVNAGLSAIWRLIAPVAGSVTVFRFAPE